MCNLHKRTEKMQRQKSNCKTKSLRRIKQLKNQHFLNIRKIFVYIHVKLSGGRSNAKLWCKSFSYRIFSAKHLCYLPSSIFRNEVIMFQKFRDQNQTQNEWQQHKIETTTFMCASVVCFQTEYKYLIQKWFKLIHNRNELRKYCHEKLLQFLDSWCVPHSDGVLILFFFS